MRDGWRRTTLGEITTFAGGVAFPPALQGKSQGDYPFIKVSDMNHRGNELDVTTASNWIGDEERQALRARAWPRGTVVFPKVGAALLTEKRRALTTNTIFDNNIMGLVPTDAVHPRFLLYFMEQVALADVAQLGTVPSVNQSGVARIPISLPPMREQLRIVDVISHVDIAIRAAEGEAEALGETIDRLRQILPEADARPLGSLLTSIDSGVSLATAPNEAAGPRLLRVSAVQRAQFRPEEYKRAGNDATLPDRARVGNGDVLMTRSNTPDRVGFVALTRDIGDDVYIPDLIWRLIPDRGRILPEYLVQVLSSSYGRREITARASGVTVDVRWRSSVGAIWRPFSR